ncbi:cytochrome P450 [Nostoc linckia z18]|uniref:Cytochrome P450 n=2 Tax=Nostoc linckia TaxID=92942 RepID=A0A9Q6ELY0_NOSLI|nr:cytochrome P450 [Nostoc linckia]PHK29503.1 cytochrome P450 [Nostoc linckia z15]PHK47030.1 cytochrome P450 [Nostoc linckia z16]PHJ61541.1 cytochrome P450 [Nostoc linckia z1]PHJ65821.1 cytochrome P450 [Nostoc linckia z3]PHJ72105.1 cytochrome P450 [Nostoc linckia z2]
MTTTYNLPDGPQIPRWLRTIKFISQPVKYVDDFAKIYGDSFTIQSNPSDNPIVYFSQPEALEQIFTSDLSSFEVGRGNTGLRFLLGDRSFMLSDGERHQRQRQLLAPPFHGERMRAYGEDIRQITQQVSHQWQMNKPLKIRNSMQEITLRVILRVVFGLEAGERFEELRRSLSDLLDFMTSPLMSSAFFFNFMQKDFGTWSPWGWILQQQKKIDELIYTLLRERRAQPQQNRQDILSLMMAARYDDGQGMSDKELHDELMTLLVAGHETTASALTWAFYWIDYLPQVRENLLRELPTVAANTDLSTIAKLPYLTAVCQETLRIYPIAMNAFFRIVKTPIEIMGYKLPKGTLIIPSIYLAHHREQVYPQPKQFKPERFLERQYSPYEYLPFGGGNRRCIGMAFAMYEMKIVLATILSEFQLSLVNKRPVRPVRRGLTTAAPAGMRMIPSPQVKLANTPALV